MSKHHALDRFGRSGNPVIRSAAFQERVSGNEEKMSLEGAVNKTGILLFLTVMAAAVSWNYQGPLMTLVSSLGMFVAFVSGIMTFGFYFFFVGWLVEPRPHNAPRAAPVYAIGYGVLYWVDFPTSRKLVSRNSYSSSVIDFLCSSFSFTGV